MCFLFVMKSCNLVIYFSENEKDLSEKLLNIFSFTFLFLRTTLINLEKFLPSALELFEIL